MHFKAIKIDTLIYMALMKLIQKKLVTDATM